MGNIEGSKRNNKQIFLPLPNNHYLDVIHPLQRTDVEAVEDSLALELSQFCFICIKHAQLQPISSNCNDHLLPMCPEILI